ncbi:tyrosine-protein phosphatase [Oceanobacillus alkalisoli]|uniref:tyrosine-protein phosphatase n=1 Tax=Oceanobacillus alkalisoli TaxID=2925113 RepID=UPI001EEFD1A1|nr:CpsB/CapC family capsule biosynthesis tyrosine phosphatase [Oceanobacillus alkalisoli]MCF3942632.1 tyrosine protein phosphatase [Oceanobacillus alkalisoli]MCG5102612.1 tyrosine protein phosphatase [Oceanobacillus alkalisoli]
MIDIHSHILPGIDDGAQTEVDSLQMARAAVKEGITTIVATPHHRNGKYDNERDNIVRWVDTLNELITNEGIPLTVLPGQETRINGDMIAELEKEIILPINNTKYVFVEFPSAHVPRYASQMLFDIQVAGYIPIIVHPERNQELIEHPNRLYEFVKKGALTQVTAASVVGKFGKNIQKFSRQIIEANLTHFIASDAHNTTTRGFAMNEAFQLIQNDYGDDYVYMYLENSQLLIDNQNVNRVEPSNIKRKKFLGLF